MKSESCTFRALKEYVPISRNVFKAKTKAKMKNTTFMPDFMITMKITENYLTSNYLHHLIMKRTLDNS